LLHELRKVEVSRIINVTVGQTVPAILQLNTVAWTERITIQQVCLHLTVKEITHLLYDSGGEQANDSVLL
jgi:hypothetical protein